MARNVTPKGKLLKFTPNRSPRKRSNLVDDLVANNAQLTATLERLCYVFEAILADVSVLDVKKLESEMSSALATSARLRKLVQERGYATSPAKSVLSNKSSAHV